MTSPRASRPSPERAPDARRKPERIESGIERRAVLRVPVEVEVSIDSDSHFYVGLTGDLSTAGLFVATWRRLPVGAEVDLALSLPDGAVTAHGRVRWVRDLAEGVTPGLGVSFDALSDLDRRRIEAFCVERAPLYHDVE